MTESSPHVTVVVTLVSGTPQHLKRCLGALFSQVAAPTMEVLVPYDEPVAEVRHLTSDFPQVRFILAEGLETAVARSGASREHHDSLRTIGLVNARGQIIAMIEDLGTPTQGWCRSLVDALERHPEAGAVGGGMTCGSQRLLNRAVCYSDYWRYQAPLPEVQSTYASDANLAYRRTALEAVRDSWDDGYHETVVQFALLAHGYEVWLAPAAIVAQERGELPWPAALRERFVWGRSFAATRVRDRSPLVRVVYAGFCPVLPLLITSRAARIALERGGFWDRFMPASFLVLILSVVWSIGEATGYLSGRVAQP